MDTSTPPMFELLDSDEDDQPNIDFSKFVLNSDSEEEDIKSQPVFLLGLESQLPAIGTSIDTIQPSAVIFSQQSQPSLPLSSSQAIKQNTSKRSRPKKAKPKTAASNKKRNLSFKCKLNGQDYLIAKKDINVLDLIGGNLKRIADTARERGPFGSMRSLKLQLVQVKTILDILSHEPLEETVPRDLWDEMLQTVFRVFQETQSVVEVCKTEVMEHHDFSHSFSFSQNLSVHIDDDDSLLPPTPNVRTTRQSLSIDRRPSQKRKAKPQVTGSRLTDPSAAEPIVELATKRNRLQTESSSQHAPREPTPSAPCETEQSAPYTQSNLPEADDKIEANQDLQCSSTPSFEVSLFEFETQKESTSATRESHSISLQTTSQATPEANATEINPSPDLLAEETYRMDCTQASRSPKTIQEPLQSSQTLSTEGGDILAGLQEANRPEAHPAVSKEPDIIFETQMFEPSQSESAFFSPPLDDGRLQRNLKLGRCRFSLLPYIKQGVLKLGENNIRMHMLDGIYTGSLRENGKIESNGVVFNTIGYWVQSLYGKYLSSLKMDQRKSFRVEYEDQDLAEIVFNTILTSASQPLKMPPKAAQLVGLSATQIPATRQEKVFEIQPKPSAESVVLPSTPKRQARSTAPPITKILIHPPEEFYRSCRCEEEMWDRLKPLPKKLLDEVSNW